MKIKCYFCRQKYSYPGEHLSGDEHDGGFRGWAWSHSGQPPSPATTPTQPNAHPRGGSPRQEEKG